MSDGDGEHGDGGGSHGGGGESPGSGGEHGGGDHEAAGDVAMVAKGAGEVLDGVGGLLGDDEDTKEAREALETAGEAVEAVEKGAEAVEDLMKAADAIGSGDAGKAASALGGGLNDAGAGVGAVTDLVGGLVDDTEAKEALETVGNVARDVGKVAQGLGHIVEGAEDLLEGLGDLFGGRSEVEYHFTVDGEDTRFHVRFVHFRDSIGELYEGSVEVECERDTVLEESELLGKDVHLSIERGEEQRNFRGIVRHARVSATQDKVRVHFDVVPAIWLMSQTMDSRVYQDLTVPELVEKVVDELVGSRHRTVRKDLTETYEDHEYLVQHRESHFHFLSRLCDEEGIFFYFDHDEGDHEILVLADSNDNRPLVREDNDGQIQFEENENQAEGREVATHVHRHQRIGATDAVVSGYDWTNPGMNVRHDRVERGQWNGPALEVHDHHHAVRHHGYDDGGGSYQSHTAERHSRLHTERMDIARGQWTVSTTVVTAKPGHIFELVGADTHDGRYLIVSCSASGTSGSHGGSFHNTLQCIPASMPFRPPAPVRPNMPGPETATVVGPAGEEIYTDRHGRIKVQFHWDRLGERNEHSSAWMRVTQGWAGPGWGIIFIPRIGMEVVVSFLGGDPDRPIVTGCVYNGQNPPPYTLPDEKTKSTIKTNSSLGGGGYNELRFEDKAGEEEVWIHAQKDFNEVVEHCHTTHVKVDQSNTVDHDQTETIGNDQTLHVKNCRTKTVDVDETNTVKGDRTTTIGPDGGNDHLWVMADRVEQIDMHDSLTVVNGHKNMRVNNGQFNLKCLDHFKLTQNSINEVYVKDCFYTAVVGRVQLKSGEGVWYDAYPDGLLNIKTTGETHIEAQQDAYLNSSMAVKIDGGTKIVLQAPDEISLVCGGSSIKLTPGGIEIAGPTIKINATAGATEIDAKSQVKIKC